MHAGRQRTGVCIQSQRLAGVNGRGSNMMAEFGNPQNTSRDQAAQPPPAEWIRRGHSLARTHIYTHVCIRTNVYPTARTTSSRKKRIGWRGWKGGREREYLDKEGDKAGKGMLGRKTRTRRGKAKGKKDKEGEECVE
eukprot:365396-Chlamydomonas_euryale.AAC.22